MSKIFLVTLSVLVLTAQLFSPTFSHGEGKAPVVHWREIAAAIDKHPALKLAGGELERADAEIKLAGQYPNPEISFSVGQGRETETGDTALVTGIELEIPIDAPGAYWNETEAAEADRDATKYLAAARKLQVVRQIKGLFYRMAYSQQFQQALKKSLAQAEKLAEVAQLRVEKGEARPMEAARLEIEQEKVRTEVLAATRLLEADRENLAAWLSGALPSDFVVAMDSEVTPDLPPLDRLLQRAAIQHPLVQSASLRISAAEARVRAEKHKRMPEMKIGGFYEKETDVRNYGGLFSIELPLWNWNSGGVARAEAAKTVAGFERELELKNLETAIRRAHAEAAEARERAVRYRTVILPKARQTAASMEKLYQIGETGVMDLLDARRSLIEIETDAIEAAKDSWIAHLELMTLSGDDNE